MNIKNIKDFTEAFEEYINHSARDSLMIGVKKYKFDKSIFNKDSELLYSIENELIKYDNFLISKTYAFLDILKKTMENDRSFNIDSFLKEDLNFPRTRYIIIKNYLFRDINIFNEITKDSYNDIRKLSVANCSVDRLQEFLNDKNKTIRLMAYSRLGPIGYNDLAIKDKVKSVRRWGIENTPFFDKILGKLSKERSTSNYLLILEKVGKEDLPFFLSPSFLLNKNVGNYIKREIKNEIKRRLS